MNPRPSDTPTSDKPAPPGLDRMLANEFYRFRFFQAVRLLQRLHADRQRVGTDAVPDREAVRFGVHTSLEFPASEIRNLAPPAEPDGFHRMTVEFMGLTGPSGVLPRHYTELLLNRIRNRDHTLRDFLDLFNHRLISLFYRAWEKYRGWIAYERTEATAALRRAQGPEAYRLFVINERPILDRFSQCLLDLAGVGEPALRYSATSRRELAPRHEVADDTLRYYAGLFAQRHRSAVGLAGMLHDYFNVPVEIIQLWGQWLTLSPENQSRFIAVDGNMQLGVDVVVGERVWDVQGKFRVRIGPLNYEQFGRFLPSGDSYRPLTHFVRLYVGMEFDFDIQLVLNRDEVPPPHLTQPTMSGVRLGWDSWLWNQFFSQDVADTVLQVHDDRRASA